MAAQDDKLKQMRRLLAADVSFERACHKLNDPRNRPTPRVTVEATMLCVRERGLAALKEPASIERLSRCDEDAKTEINRRIAKLGIAK